MSKHKLIFLILCALIFTGCATSTKQTERLLKNKSHSVPSVTLESVPFINQKENHCGPATLAMVLIHQGVDVDMEKLTSQTFTQGMKGTFQTEMISAARRQGMLALPLRGGLEALTKELISGNPVIVFQNLGFSFYPKWHYSVAVGYDLDGPDIILHTGPDKFEKSDMRFFERTWKLANYWGLLVLKPGELSQTQSELQHTKASAALEEMGMLKEAEVSYKSILKKWPDSLGSLIGMGNIAYNKKEFAEAISYLKKASSYHPKSSIVWHNLAIAQGSAGMKKWAKESSLKALALTEGEVKLNYKKSLKEYLK